VWPAGKVIPVEVVTDAAPVYPAVLDELVPSAWHHVEQYANNPIEPDHGRLKHRLRPMRGLRTDRTAQVVIAGHALMQNLCRGDYELGVDAGPAGRVTAAFIELAHAIWRLSRPNLAHLLIPQRNSAVLVEEYGIDQLLDESAGELREGEHGCFRCAEDAVVMCSSRRQAETV
jgi:hypothetical protein